MVAAFHLSAGEAAASGSDEDSRLLRRLLDQAGIGLSLEALRALVAGVVAAPAGQDADAWFALLGGAAAEGRLDPHLAASLRALRERAAAALTAGPEPGPAARLARLRGELARRGLDGFVVPRADAHQGEYVPARDQRLGWLTGFSGSAGLAVVLAERAALFVDGRYTLQAAAEVPETLYQFCHLIDHPLADWLAGAAERGARIGYDPWLHTRDWVDKTARALERAGMVLVPVADNPLDAVWTSQPPPPLAPVVVHDIGLAGRSAEDKRLGLAAALQINGLAAAVLTQPDSIAWLLNIRGADVPHTPLPLCFALLFADARVSLFIDPRKLTPGLSGHLGPAVTVHPPEALGPALDRLGVPGEDGTPAKRVQVDPATAAAWIFDRLTTAGATITCAPDPCTLPKACKNPVELAGSRAAHRRDGAAMVRFLHWLEQNWPRGGQTEAAAARQLLQFRRQGPRFRDLSFETISAAGPNGAIVHYRVSSATNRVLEPGTLFLLDSGGQYLDGTTDVTRTVALGPPDAEMCERFTRVLKGHIALATVRFPPGTLGAQLDALARVPLWEVGLDYDHGTGHGVGSYLSVHEGPQRIARVLTGAPLQPGMILSNEPGCYVPGAYGIRIENLQVVCSVAPPVADGRPMLGFETLTLVPIDRRLIRADLLTAAERAWVDRYHARVAAELRPLLDGAVMRWLETATRPLGDG